MSSIDENNNTNKAGINGIHKELPLPLTHTFPPSVVHASTPSKRSRRPWHLRAWLSALMVTLSLVPNLLYVTPTRDHPTPPLAHPQAHTDSLHVGGYDT